MVKLNSLEVPKSGGKTEKLPFIVSLDKIKRAKPVHRLRGFTTKLNSGYESTLKNKGAKVESQLTVSASNHNSFEPERNGLTTPKTIASAEGKGSPGNPATIIDNKEQGKEVIGREQLRNQRLEEIITELKKQGLPKYVGDLDPPEEYYFRHEVPARAEAILLQRFPEYVAQNTPDKPVTPSARELQENTVPVSRENQNDATTSEKTSKTATKEPQKDTVPPTPENQQANPLPNQPAKTEENQPAKTEENQPAKTEENQPAKTEENQQPKPEELTDSELSEAESVRPQDRQERIENVVKSLESQVKALEEALKQGSDFKENLRKGIFGPKVLFMLRLINILANNSVITNLLKLDSKVADIKDLWRDYQELKNDSRNRKRNPDAIQFAATFNGEALDKGSEAKEANFENANKEFIKEKSQGFLNEIASELQEEGMDTESIQEMMFDEIDSLVDAGREVDLRRLSQYKPQILEKIKTQVQNFAKGKITKNVLGLNIMIAIRS